MAQSKKKGGEVVAAGETQRMQDIKGTWVEVPKGVTAAQLGGRFVDQSLPQPDVDKDTDEEYIPEFVNVSGKIQKMHTPYNPHGKVKVLVWGIWKGLQYRHAHSVAGVIWEHPPFLEREYGKGGFDDEYALTEKQVVDLIHSMMGGSKKNDIELTVLRVHGLVDNGKFDPKDPKKRVRDDRQEVVSRAMVQVRYLGLRRDLKVRQAEAGTDDPSVIRLLDDIDDMRRELGYKIASRPKQLERAERA